MYKLQCYVYSNHGNTFMCNIVILITDYPIYVLNNQYVIQYVMLSLVLSDQDAVSDRSRTASSIDKQGFTIVSLLMIIFQFECKRL